MQTRGTSTDSPVARIRAGARTLASGSQAVATGVGTGFSSEASSAVRDIRIIGRFFRDQGTMSGVRLLRDGIKEIGSSRAGVRDALAGAFITPIREDIAAGRTSHAIGRAGFHIATLILPGDKVLRAAAAIVARSAESADPAATLPATTTL